MQVVATCTIVATNGKSRPKMSMKDHDYNGLNKTTTTSACHLNADVSERTASTVASESSNRSLKITNNMMHQQQQQQHRRQYDEQQQQEDQKATHGTTTSATFPDVEGIGEGLGEDVWGSKQRNLELDFENGFLNVQTQVSLKSPHSITDVIPIQSSKSTGSKHSSSVDLNLVDSTQGESNRIVAAISPNDVHVKIKGDIGVPGSDVFHVPCSDKNETFESTLSSFLSPTSAFPKLKQAKSCDTMLSTWLDKRGKEPRACTNGDGHPVERFLLSSLHDNSSSSLPALVDYAADSSTAASFSIDSTTASHSLASTVASRSVASEETSPSLEFKPKGGIPAPKEAIVKDYLESRAPPARRTSVQSGGGRWASGAGESRDSLPSLTLPMRDRVTTPSLPITNFGGLLPSMNAASPAPPPAHSRPHRRRSLCHVPDVDPTPPPLPPPKTTDADWPPAHPRQQRRRSLGHIPDADPRPQPETTTATSPPAHPRQQRRRSLGHIPDADPPPQPQPQTKNAASSPAHPRRRRRRSLCHIPGSDTPPTQTTNAASPSGRGRRPRRLSLGHIPGADTAPEQNTSLESEGSVRRRPRRVDSNSAWRGPVEETSRHSRRLKSRMRSNSLDMDDTGTSSHSSRSHRIANIGERLYDVSTHTTLSAATATSTFNSDAWKMAPRVDMTGLIEVDGGAWSGGTAPDPYNSAEDSSISRRQSVAGRLQPSADTVSSSSLRTQRRTSIFDESFFTSTTSYNRCTAPMRRLTWTTEPEQNFSDWVILIRAGGADGDSDAAETYHVHKCVVGLGARASDLLLEKFDDSESTREKSTAIELPRKAADLVPTMLDYMYSFHGEPLNEISTTTATALRYLADVFGVETMLREVNTFIENDLSDTTVEVYRADARLFHDERLLNAALKWTGDEN
jgi:hypothetical protein